MLYLSLRKRFGTGTYTRQIMFGFCLMSKSCIYCKLLNVQWRETRAARKWFITLILETYLRRTESASGRVQLSLLIREHRNKMTHLCIPNRWFLAQSELFVVIKPICFGFFFLFFPLIWYQLLFHCIGQSHSQAHKTLTVAVGFLCGVLEGAAIILLK